MTEKHHRNALEAGYDLHWYTIQDVLGQGGFGITYLAYDNNLKSSVAIKEYLPSGLAMRDSDSTIQPLSDGHRNDYRWGLKRFLTEARTLTQFDHDNIVRVLTVFELNQTAYMVMRYEEGKALHTLLPKGATLDEKWLKRMITPITGGLSKVHTAGFIHRDIKPANIFIRADQSPVLIDFGSARQAFGSATRTLTAMVSPGYAPFEQYHAKSDQQGPWTDIYGLGATLYRATAGQAPVDALERSESILNESRDNYVSVFEHADTSQYCSGFLAAIDHALAFNEKNRPQTLQDWLQELQQEHAEHTTSPTTVPAKPASRPPLKNNRPGKKPSSFFGTLLTFLIFILLMAALYIVKPWRALDRLQTEAAPSHTTQDSTQGNDIGTLQSNDTDDLISNFQQTLKNNAGDTQAQSTLATLAEYHAVLAEQAIESGQPGIARQQFRKALEAAPDEQTRRELRQRFRRYRE